MRPFVSSMCTQRNKKTKTKKNKKNCYESAVLKEVLYVPLCVALCVSFNFFFLNLWLGLVAKGSKLEC